MQIGQKQMQLENIKRHISNLKEKEQKLQLSISPLHIKPTQVIGQIETYDKAIKL